MPPCGVALKDVAEAVAAVAVMVVVRMVLTVTVAVVAILDFRSRILPSSSHAAGWLAGWLALLLLGAALRCSALERIGNACDQWRRQGRERAPLYEAVGTGMGEHGLQAITPSAFWGG